jgi:hypothetical protein
VGIALSGVARPVREVTAAPDDLAAREAFDERAGILEYSAGKGRRRAELEAARMLLRDGVPIPHHIAEAIAQGLLPKGWAR